IDHAADPDRATDKRASARKLVIRFIRRPNREDLFGIRRAETQVKAIMGLRFRDGFDDVFEDDILVKLFRRGCGIWKLLLLLPECYGSGDEQRVHNRQSVK